MQSRGNKHRDLSPHICEECTEGFTTKANLTAHMRRNYYDQSTGAVGFNNKKAGRKPQVWSQFRSFEALKEFDEKSYDFLYVQTNLDCLPDLGSSFAKVFCSIALDAIDLAVLLIMSPC